MGAGRGQARRAQIFASGLDTTPGGFWISGKISESVGGEVRFYPEDADINNRGEKFTELGEMLRVRQLIGERVEIRILSGEPQVLNKTAKGKVGVKEVGVLSAVFIGDRLVSGLFDDLKIWGDSARVEVSVLAERITVPELESLEPLSF